MPADPALAALPAIRKLAEAITRETWEANVRLFADAGLDVEESPDDSDQGRQAFGLCVAVQADLLSDLSRPASMAALCDLIGAKIGRYSWEVSAAVHGHFGTLQGIRLQAGLPLLPTWEPTPTAAESLRALALHVLGERP